MNEVGAHTAKLRIRWYPISREHPSVLDSRLARLDTRQTLTVASQPGLAGRERCIYMMLLTEAPITGAISLCESFAAQDAYVRKTVGETVITTASLAVICALLSGVLGLWLVGNPVSALSEKARRIGAGDFSRPLRLPRNDELAALAQDMNAMCEQLQAAAVKVEKETARRIAAVDQLRHADRLTTLGKLASGLAHELGTPLNVIEARADMIASGETSAVESMDYARVIRDASERMTRLIHQLLDFARPRIATPALNPVFGLISRTVEMLSYATSPIFWGFTNDGSDVALLKQPVRQRVTALAGRPADEYEVAVDSGPTHAVFTQLAI